MINDKDAVDAELRAITQRNLELPRYMPTYYADALSRAQDDIARLVHTLNAVLTSAGADADRLHKLIHQELSTFTYRPAED